MKTNYTNRQEGDFYEGLGSHFITYLNGHRLHYIENTFDEGFDLSTINSKGEVINWEIKGIKALCGGRLQKFVIPRHQLYDGLADNWLFIVESQISATYSFRILTTKEVRSAITHSEQLRNNYFLPLKHLINFQIAGISTLTGVMDFIEAGVDQYE